MSPVRSAGIYLRRSSVTGLISLVLAVTAAIISVILVLSMVLRGDDPSGLGEWVGLIGMLLSNAGSLLAEHRTGTNRATDPIHVEGDAL